MRALGEPDAFPSGDLGLLRAMALKDSRELAQHAEAWRPWRAYAAMYLWRITSQRAKSGKEPTASSTQKEALGSIPSSQHLSLVV
jgi:3-methyladenine DNA glycosylase/8-oxoguanine DNA glycosylase